MTDCDETDSGACELWLILRLFCLNECSFFKITLSGSHDSACASHPHSAHPCVVSAPPLSPAGQRLDPVMAVPAVLALHSRPPQSSADLRRLPGAFLPQGRLQGERAISHLCIQHAVPRDGVYARRASVCTTKQWLLVNQPPTPPLIPLTHL